jgi:AAA domain
LRPTTLHRSSEPLPGSGGLEPPRPGKVWRHQAFGGLYDLSNAIAYDDLMVFGTPDRDPYPGADGWINIRSGDASRHWIQAKGDALRLVLSRLSSSGVAEANIRMLSPFRQVAKAAEKIYATQFPSVREKDLNSWVGTVHTMQGKEADAVILILGGDPRRPGARGFATKTPNLLNVAVSRAKRHLIVIGNRDTWGTEGCFTVLADRLPERGLPQPRRTSLRAAGHTPATPSYPIPSMRHFAHNDPS